MLIVRVLFDHKLVASISGLGCVLSASCLILLVMLPQSTQLKLSNGRVLA